jgi:hypothetical protein
MTALACLRIVLTQADLQVHGRHLEQLVGKYAEAFLEARWRPPRRYEVMGPNNFLLVDPQIDGIDGADLRLLADNMAEKLFGDSRIGEVHILALQGEEEEVNAFAALPNAALMDEQVLAALEPDIAARMLDLTSAATRDDVQATVPVRVLRTTAGLSPVERLAASHPPLIDEDRTTFRGVYFVPRQSFYGSLLLPFVAAWKRKYSRRTFASFPPEELAMEFDRVSLTVAAESMQHRPPPGVLAVPLSFASASTRMRLVRLRPFLDRLLRFDRLRLSATLYGCAPAPPFETVRLAVDGLRDYFGAVDLKTSNPDFPLYFMFSPCARSVTLAPDGRTAPARLQQIRSFLARMSEFRASRVWAAVADVQTQEELRLCIDMGAPFVSGPAVTPPMIEGAPLVTAPPQALPLRVA